MAKPRIRLINLKSAGSDENKGEEGGPLKEIVAIALGHRVLISEQAEIWTVLGLMKDGNPTKESIGELSFVLIPGDTQPATAITGFIAVAAPYEWNVSESAFKEQLRALVAQLGYDRDGYYASIGIGGKLCYEENFQRL